MSYLSGLENIRVVMCQTTHPGNIGAAARAIKTMGLHQLVLVQPKCFPHPQASAMAAGADDVLAEARVVDNLAEALVGCTWAVAMTVRARDLSHEHISIQDFTQRLPREVRAGQVAVVLGTEMSGLTNAECDLCHVLCSIPTDPQFGSLNVAAAVQILCYEARMALMEKQVTVAQEMSPLASHEEVEYFYGHLEDVLLHQGFLDPANPGRLMTRLRRLFGRVRLEHEEVNILRGMLNALVPDRKTVGSDRSAAGSNR
ncbi:MAG: tRNA (cytosine(32)/uridine(32)-2'-O)-methyltransferase TrmJ [Ferrovum sp. 37-45-19]|jgi:tRNA/rRNA methyltransferase|uniref:RNA methyltransferase n=1 Tax=Ferrovum sp. JA12 TaxID=1356299 RepID=UPI000703BD20|nr:RNA methyltransferase [Ferrovum sp. JA12]OYV80062.1 MAG: tRNA (cytosine(32)/uridine(32)-2'-O)-methyltransferase TrmJ [Ferrovum sp. 21-44-67]OYV93616.1 MAG: tRNA (cytosine(32)/uridine(32)-2'-O)-methyltransferase TrmJ [Ferrovum sp. 37-45-19]OZB33489.1 MAG: tRNA (cytosine(32)/uridine(32)-2'-O)-methyltransferase TrmJ [Ferrovum sp. 34-44-207]HQT81939.1 RNA methyltransferase [Ferrovaceae bacterium]KRH78021.1 tRNA (cytidine/uridine-2'-O-)-methyltransferase TrmJ [Ferrovum sp. JA12]